MPSGGGPGLCGAVGASPVLEVMQAELTRNMAALHDRPQPPYFLAVERIARVFHAHDHQPLVAPVDLVVAALVLVELLGRGGARLAGRSCRVGEDRPPVLRTSR